MVKELQYKFLEHKADAKFQAFGKTLNQAFENAAIAMTSILTEDKIKPKITKQIQVKGTDKKNLLLNFLEEILFLIDTEQFILADAKVNIKNLILTATLKGDKLQNYETKSDIKAITYNQMKIKENPCIIQVVCDI